MHISNIALTCAPLSEKEREMWCHQWHMYKRDLALGSCFSTVLGPDVRYETACAFLEFLTKIEVKETPSKTDVKCSVTLNPPKREFRYKTYETYGKRCVRSVESCVWMRSR